MLGLAAAGACADGVTGEAEHIRIRETGPDTGIFAGYVPTSGAGTARPGGTLATHPLSRIEAQPTATARADIDLADSAVMGPVDPYGTVFDSRNGRPVSGVRVTILDERTGSPARVRGEDLRAAYPATVTTGEPLTDGSGRRYDPGPGEYRFPFVEPGTYRIEVEPPIGFAAPSEVPDEKIRSLEAAPLALSEASRLAPFVIAPGSPVEIDIPLDGAGFITVTRTGSADELTAGDFVEFTVTAGTNAETDIRGSILDEIPPGLALEPGTVLVDGATPSRAPRVTDGGRRVLFPGIVMPEGGVARISLPRTGHPEGPRRG